MLEDRLLRVEREIFLAALGLPLESVAPWVIDRLTAALEETTLQTGQVLFRAGESLEFLHFLHDGRIQFTHPDGRFWTAAGRWVLGGFEILGDRPATHTATALGDFAGMRIRAQAWVDLVEDSSALARSAVVNAARALMRIEERIPFDAPSSLAQPRLPIRSSGPLGLVEKLALLLEVRMLRAAGVQALADLAAASREVCFDAGAPLIEPGATSTPLIRVVEGDVLAERNDHPMRRRYGPGDLVCGAAVLGQVSGDWQARALTPTRSITIPLEALFDMMEEHFDLVRSVFAALGTRRDLLVEHMAGETENLVLT